MKKLLTGVLLTLAAAHAIAENEVKINHDGTDGLVVEADGTLLAEGAATVWRDELQPLIGQKLDNRKSAVKHDYEEFTVVFEKNDADLGDGVVMNIQMNHDWDGTTPVKPHLHWFQSQSATPNWLIEYRWHQNGQAKVTDWTRRKKVDTNAFTYSSGTILQITGFGEIDPPAAPTGVSSVLQLKLMRDSKAQSSEYNGIPDDYSVDAHALSLDLHIKINTMGSRTEYTK